ncbi:hypothetical protein BD413DRAFT_248066 [Trametes elegans]|nr:hypothetical protein BD413DRAFT_248066 [Trametes elegans]
MAFSADLNPPRYPGLVVRSVFSSEQKDGQMSTGVSGDSNSNGHSAPPSSGSSGNSHSASAPSSPVVPALVAVTLFVLAGFLVWWLVSRMRRSGRSHPRPAVHAEKVVEKPVLTDVKLGVSHLDEKRPYPVHWDGLSPMTVEFVSDDDRRRWQASAQAHSQAPHDPYDRDDMSSLSSESASSTSAPHAAPRPKSTPFSIFTRASSPASTLVPEKDVVKFDVAVFIAMPARRSSPAAGELYLGVARSSIV